MIKERYSKKMIVFLCTFVYFAGYFLRKTFAAVMANMLENNVIERDIAGLVGTALFVFYGLGQIISGRLGDRVEPRRLMFTGALVSAICNLLLPILPSQYLLIPLWAINGFAQALLWPPIVRILSDNLTHEKYVSANLIVTCGAHLSTVLLYVYTPLCLKFMSWEWVFFTSGIFGILVGIIFVILMAHCVYSKPSEVTSKKKESGEGTAPLSKILGSNGLYTVFFCIVAMGFMRDGIESWLPTLYLESFGRSSEESILVSVILPVFSILSLFIVRAIHRKSIFNNEVSGSLVLFSISAVLCIPLALLMEADGGVARALSLVFASLVCACMHSCNFLLISCLPGRFAKTNRASTVGGICNAFTYVGSAASMYLIALMSEALGWKFTVVGFIIICALGVVFSVLSLKKYTSFLKK